jgi:hypothetical protein
MSVAQARAADQAMDEVFAHHQQQWIIENPQLIEKILKHLGLEGTADGEALPRAPPARAGLLD